MINIVYLIYFLVRRYKKAQDEKFSCLGIHKGDLLKGACASKSTKFTLALLSIPIIMLLRAHPAQSRVIG